MGVDSGAGAEVACPRPLFHILVSFLGLYLRKFSDVGIFREFELPSTVRVALDFLQFFAIVMDVF